MSTSHAEFTGSIPAYYDSHLGPMLFEPYARDVADRIGTLNASNVLELACEEGPSANEAALGLIRGNPVVNAIHERGTADVDTIVQAVADALASELGDWPMRAPIEAHVVVAS